MGIFLTANERCTNEFRALQWTPQVVDVVLLGYALSKVFVHFWLSHAGLKYMQLILYVQPAIAGFLFDSAVVRWSLTAMGTVARLDHN